VVWSSCRYWALLFHVDIRYAIGASLVSVIATSSGAAAAYVREGYSNIRIGMFLEIATTMGALLGAYLAAQVSTGLIAVIFGVVLIYSAYLSSRDRSESVDNGQIVWLLCCGSTPPIQPRTALKLTLSGPCQQGFH